MALRIGGARIDAELEQPAHHRHGGCFGSAGQVQRIGALAIAALHIGLRGDQRLQGVQ